MTVLSAYARPELAQDALGDLPPGWTHIVAVRNPDTGTYEAGWGRKADGSLHQWVPTEVLVCTLIDHLGMTMDSSEWGWAQEVLHGDHS